MRNAGVWAAVIIILFSGVFLWQSLELEYEGKSGIGPGFFPFWISLVLLILSIIYLIKSIKDSISIKEILPKNEELWEFFIIIGSMVLFVFIVKITGFIIACTLSLILLLFRNFKWYWSISISVSISVLIFMIFAKALAIPLPVNSLGW